MIIVDFTSTSKTETAQLRSPNMQNIRRTVRRTTFFIEIVFLLEVFKKILSESSNKKIITKPET
jgi:hypothetical protein